MADLHWETPESDKKASFMTAKLGLPVLYRPRVPYGRQSELFAFVTRIVDAERGMVDLIAFPANSEVVHYNNILPKGDKIQIHCWEPVTSDGSVDESLILSLVQMAIAPINAEIQQLKVQLERRGPGRPPSSGKSADAA